MAAELAELSDTDALTGLANRRHFERRLAEEHARAMRQGLPLALVLLDVDHFKAYNDHHGHPAGDACLRRVAGLLREQARRPGELAARWGGEEFVLLLPHTLANDALALARLYGPIGGRRTGAWLFNRFAKSDFERRGVRHER